MNLLRALRCAFVPLVAALAAPLPAAASDAWPSKVIRLVVPFAAGGSTDLVARQVAQALSEKLANPVIVENKPGAGGTVGSDWVAKQPADGYTLLMGSVSTHGVAPSLYAKLPYDPLRGFTPLTVVASIPNVLVVGPNVPARSLGELVALAKRSPGKLSFASNGQGTSNHLAVELLKTIAGVDLQHVPYKGSGPAMADLLGGHVDMMFDVVMTSYPNIKGGKLRPLAVSSLARSPMLPEVPTVAEQGYPGFEAIVWFGLFAPPNMPPELATRVSNELIGVIRSPRISGYLAEQGALPVANTPAEFTRFIAADIAKWKKVAETAGIKPE